MTTKKTTKRKKPAKQKTIVVGSIPGGRMLALANSSPEEVLADLQTLVSSSGWKRLKQLVQEQIDLWSERMDEEDFKDMVEFKHVRDQKNIYRSLLSLPERHISLIIDKPGTRNEDPYV